MENEQIWCFIRVWHYHFAGLLNVSLFLESFCSNFLGIFILLKKWIVRPKGERIRDLIIRIVIVGAAKPHGLNDEHIWLGNHSINLIRVTNVPVDSAHHTNISLDNTINVRSLYVLVCCDIPLLNWGCSYDQKVRSYP